MDSVAAIEEALAGAHHGKKWVLAVDVAAAATDTVARLKKWGAAGVLVVSAVEGVGDLPDAPIVYTRTSGPTIMAGLRAFDASIADPSPHLEAAVDEFDPDRGALVITSPFSNLTEAIGRRVYGPRPPAQSALEDKLAADDIWDAAGVDRAPSAIVPVAKAVPASRRLAGPLGSVWVADNKEGWHGGADYVRWVRTKTDEQGAVDWYEARADQVRVMPFLDGIPCSIHGWVTDDGVAIFRPMEILVLRRTDKRGFVYSGMANFWDPPQRFRREIRSAARAVGEHLVERVGYRGPYGIDGVLTAEGFRPTELNPRITAGHGMPGASTGLMIGAMARAQFAGDLVLDSRWLESTLVAAGDEKRGGRGLISLGDALPERKVHVTFRDGRAEEAEEEDRQATLNTGRSPRGGLVLIRFNEERVDRGPSVAPLAVAALNFARTTWDLSIPPVAPAPDLFPHENRGDAEPD